uniref:Galanin receptor type 2 n=1 Tax=Magallana gigas TaxID=29159 RepID=K1PHH3_MAGGI
MDPHNFRTLENCVSDVFDKYLKSSLSLLASTAYATSGFYIAVLSVFRYIIIAYPLKANMILTKRTVFVTFFTVFLISLGYGIFKTLKINLSSKLVKPIDLLVSYLIPLTVMAVFHTLKLLTLKRNKFRSTKKSTRKLEVVVIMVVMALFLFLLPWHVLAISYEFQLFKPGYIAVTVSSLLLQLNNCINPVFYAFLSPRVREGICFCFVAKRGNKRKTPTATISTNIYSSTTNALSCASLSTSTSSGPVTPSPTPNIQRVISSHIYTNKSSTSSFGSTLKDSRPTFS